MADSKRGKARKNEATIKNEDLKYEVKVKWSFATEPLAWSEDALEKVLFGGLTSWVRAHIKRELDRQQPRVAVFHRMMPDLVKLPKAEQETINKFLKLQAGAGFAMQDRLQDEFIISEDMVIGEPDNEEETTEEK